MAVLFVASVVAWAQRGNGQIRQNWEDGRHNLSSHGTARQIFDGVCIGVLGLTGFECQRPLVLANTNMFPDSMVTRCSVICVKH